MSDYYGSAPEGKRVVFIDPVPGMYPYCVCGKKCEFPCWERFGLDDAFDPQRPGSCCCATPQQAREQQQAEDAQATKGTAVSE